LIRPELIRALMTDAAALLPPQLAALVRATAQIILQPIFDMASPHIVFDRIALSVTRPSWRGPMWRPA
jgi:hypothetical protein